jgi:hypothetical protein
VEPAGDAVPAELPARLDGLRRPVSEAARRSEARRVELRDRSRAGGGPFACVAKLQLGGGNLLPGSEQIDPEHESPVRLGGAAGYGRHRQSLPGAVRHAGGELPVEA